MEISFWRHKSKRKGFSKLYCRISVSGERVDIGSTGICIYHDYWSGDKVTPEDPEAYFKNERLTLIRNQLYAIYNGLFRSKVTITAHKIKRAYLGDTGSVALLDAFALYLKDCKQDQERNLEGSTIKVYTNVRKKLTDFLISEHATDLLVEDFDIKWVKKFRKWMKAYPVTAQQRGHADSYIVKQTQNIKNVLIWSKLNKLVDSNPLEGLRIKGAEFGDPVFLSEEQFQLLRVHTFKSPKVQQTADVLVILCRSGFHYGDLLDLIKEYKTALRTGLDGEQWMIKERIKTEVKIHVPVFDEVQQIVDKYGGWELLPMRPLPKFNEFLKLVAAEMKFEGELAELSSKAGRKTFTDWCYNVLELGTDSVKVLLGRRSDKGLEVYGRPDERHVIAQLRKSDEMQRRKKVKE